MLSQSSRVSGTLVSLFSKTNRIATLSKVNNAALFYNRGVSSSSIRTLRSNLVGKTLPRTPLSFAVKANSHGKRFFATSNPPTNPPDAPTDQQQQQKQAIPDIVEVTYSNFEAFVANSQVPVILDCYADWCDPCKDLTPKLAKLVQQSGGSLRLAMLNVDNNPELAEQLKVTNLPTVYGLHNGKVVDGFVGVRKDEQIKQFVDGLLKLGGLSSSTKYLEEAEKRLRQGDVNGAAQLYSELAGNPNLKVEALGLAGLARCALAENNLEVATAIINQIKENFPKDVEHPEVKKAMAAMDLAGQSAPVGAELQNLIDKVQQNPADLQAKYDLAMSYFGAGRHQLSLDQCFDIIKANKHWEQDAAKKLVMKIFDALGPKDEITKAGRRRLTNLWFV